MKFDQASQQLVPRAPNESRLKIEFSIFTQLLFCSARDWILKEASLEKYIEITFSPRLPGSFLGKDMRMIQVN